MTVASPQLQQLGRLYGISTVYHDMSGVPREASDESLLAVLKALGAPVESHSEIPSAVRLKHLQDWQSVVDPVYVLHEGDLPLIRLRLPVYLLGASLPISFLMESGEIRELLWKVEPQVILEQKNVEGSVYLTAGFQPAAFLPHGYHRLKVELPGQTFHSLIICAPSQCWSPPSRDKKNWGIFLPLYAAHSRHSWGAGSYTDLKKLLQWTAGLGGEVVGTLPLLAGFFDSRYGPGPYLPASKLFWNEFYLDVESVPELALNKPAMTLLNSRSFQAELAALIKTENVNYESVLNLKRRVLELLASGFWAEKPVRFADFEIFTANHPEVMEYARFRAAGEIHGLDWRRWPQPLPGDGQEYLSRSQYHAYVQWLTAQQIEDLNRTSGSRSALLYMDLPVGVHPFSYDSWKERLSFVNGINCGAPPDPVFTNGQNWEFPPLHPWQIRTQGYQYFIRCLRHQLRACGMLRIDHIMNFHRLFWIPEGAANSDGVYVNYTAEEFYAILTLESVRHQSVIIGEDLGLVPPEVRPMMDRRGIRRMFVGQFALIAENRIGQIPSGTVASLNTHDMFPFAAFWEETDIEQRRHIKLIDDSAARNELDLRRQTKRALISYLQYRGLADDFDQDTASTLKAVLKLLAGSMAETVLINLEDLWLEQKPQNIPGTLRHQNWTHKARYSFEQIAVLPAVVRTLGEIDQIRKGESIIV